VPQADDLFGTAAERFRVRPRCACDDRSSRGQCRSSRWWQEQQLVLDFLRVQRFETAIPRAPRRPASGQTFVGAVIGSSAAEAAPGGELDRSFSSDTRRLSASAFGGPSPPPRGSRRRAALGTIGSRPNLLVSLDIVNLNALTPKNSCVVTDRHRPGVVTNAGCGRWSIKEFLDQRPAWHVGPLGADRLSKAENPLRSPTGNPFADMADYVLLALIRRDGT